MVRNTAFNPTLEVSWVMGATILFFYSFPIPLCPILYSFILFAGLTTRAIVSVMVLSFPIQTESPQLNICPVRNLSSLLTHWEFTLKLTVGSFWGHSVGSQWTHNMSLHCEIAVSFPWFATLTVSSLLPLHGESSEDLRNISQQTHGVSLNFFVCLSG